MAEDLSSADVQRSLDLLQGGAANADPQSSLTLMEDLRARLAAAGHTEIADTMDRLQRSISSRSEGATIGGHMSTLGEQVEALATSEPGAAEDLRTLAELLKGEGSRISA